MTGAGVVEVISAETTALGAAVTEVQIVRFSQAVLVAEVEEGIATEIAVDVVGAYLG